MILTESELTRSCPDDEGCGCKARALDTIMRDDTCRSYLQNVMMIIYSTIKQFLMNFLEDDSLIGSFSVNSSRRHLG